MDSAPLASRLADVFDLALSLTWRGSALMVLAVLALQVARRASAASRHLLLSVTAAALLAQPLLLAVLPPRAEAMAPRVGSPESDPGRLADPAAPRPSGALTAATSTVNSWVRQLGVARPDAPHPPLLSRARTAGGAIALALWCLAFGRLLLGALLARRLARSGPPMVEPSLLAEVADTSRLLGTALPVELRRGPAGMSPLCAGALAPTILLPADFTDWPCERRRLVLLHELAHVMRRDCLLQLVVSLAAALHAWNPLARWMVRAARLEREAATDDRVAAAGLRASDHAAELLAMARSLLGAPRPLVVGASLVPMVDGSEGLEPAAPRPGHRPSALEQRIRRILASDARRDQPTLWRAGLAVVLAAVVLVPLSRRAPVAHAATAPSVASPAANRSVSALRAAAASYLTSSDASSLRLSLDLDAQSAVEEALDALVGRHHPAAAGIVVLDPRTGEVRAMGGRRDGRSDPTLPARTAFEPASTIKTIGAAAALESGRVRTDQTFDCRDDSYRVGDKGIHDATPHGMLSLAEILVYSSNVGAARLLDAAGDEAFTRTLARLHLGAAPPVEIEGAAAGTLPSPSDWTHARAVDMACGHGAAFSQLQMAAAFAALASGGLYRAPSLLSGGGGKPERVLAEEAALAVRRLLEGVVHRDDGTGVAARVPGYRVSGKTGTGEGYATFVGAIPADAPRAVILVGAATPGVMKTGGEVAAPAFATVAARLMSAWRVPAAPPAQR